MKKCLLYGFGVFVFYCFFLYQYTKHNQPIIIYSEALLNIASKALGLDAGAAKALALPPPLIALRHKEHEMNEIRIRHEQIHHLQQTESLFLITAYSALEGIYSKHILKKEPKKAYLHKTTEQEAYLHQHDEQYIKNRKAYSSLHYINNKIDFELIDYQVTLIK